MAEGPVYLTTFIEGVLVHGSADTFRPAGALAAHSPPGPAHARPGALVPGLPARPALLNAQIDSHLGMPFRFYDKSGCPWCSTSAPAGCRPLGCCAWRDWKASSGST